ncbi:hypothetical protein [Marinimicrobium sp. C2-29]|uniref:hypothetical protein n=1 Tax=Marinimicrobium sp. C2-29 TaxID=3139825 RepID=UPI0031397D29
MTDMFEKLQNVDSGKFNGSAVALLALVLFFFGNQMRSIPETVADMARTQALLVYRIEQLEQAVANQQGAHHPATKAPSSGAPALLLARPLTGERHRLGHRYPALAFNLPQTLAVRLKL